MAQGILPAMNYRDRVPAARITGVVMTQAGDDTLVYDTDRHEVHHLNQTSAAIWRLCDGQRSVAELARDAGVDADVAQVAVNKLAEANLLVGELAPALRLSGQSRRKLMKRAALVGAGATIVSITAPLAAQAQTAACSDADCGPNTRRCCTCQSGAIRAIASGCANINAGGATGYAALCVTACIGF